MKISDFKKKLSGGCIKFGLPEPKVVSEGLVSIKVRINTECGDIEIYFNEETQTITSALIVKGERVFGINGYPESKAWHMHPLGEVKRHVKIEPMDLEDIIREYAKAIVEIKRR